MHTRRSKSFNLSETILRRCEDLEDIYFAERSLERIRTGESSTIPLEKVAKREAVKD